MHLSHLVLLHSLYLYLYLFLYLYLSRFRSRCVMASLTMDTIG